MNEIIKREVVCLLCPMGCVINVYLKDDNIIKVTGNKCKRGIDFAKEEVINPKRILTTTLMINSSIFRRVPVRSSSPVPKDMVLNFVREIKKIKVKPPIKMGDIIVKNFMNTGADIIASMDIAE
jgi:CxxC motif-containing protein